MMTRSFPTPLIVVALVAVTATNCVSPTLPLPPPNREGLTVEPPNEAGEVHVTGEPGVMDAGEQAVIINQDTLYGWIVPVDESGFEAWVEAQAGHLLSIQRRQGDNVGQGVDILVPEPPTP
jgi:hypothetical protein